MDRHEKVEKGAVVDTSAIMGGMPISGIQRLFISPLVERELDGVEGVDLLKAANLEVREPGQGSIDIVIEAARASGDDARVSDADIEILALALELELPLLTDDYSIQNLAKHLSVPYETVRERGITKKIEWIYRCKGCGKYFNELVPDCPLCGSMVKSARKLHR